MTLPQNPSTSKYLVLTILYFPLFANVTGSASSSQFVINTIFAVLCSLYLSYLVWKRFNIRVPSEVLVILSAACIILIISIALQSPVSRLASDVGRLLLLAFFFLAGHQIGNLRLINEEKMARILIAYGVLGVAFSLLIYVEAFWPILDFFKGRRSDDRLFFHFSRASGFSGYPTDFGSMLILTLLVTYFSARRKIISIKYALIATSIMLLGLVLSAARGAMVQLAVVIILLLSIALIKGRVHLVPIKFVSFIVLVASFSGIFFYTEVMELYNNRQVGRLNFFDYILVNVNNLDASVLHRFREIELLFSVLTGEISMPTHDERARPHGLNVIEGFYPHYVIRFGHIGLIVSIILAVYLSKSCYSSRSLILPSAMLLWCLSFFLSLAPFSDVMSRGKGLAIYALLIGFSSGFVNCYRRRSFSYLASSASNGR